MRRAAARRRAVRDEDQEARLVASARVRRFASTAAGAAIVLAVFVFALPRIAGYGEVAEVARGLSAPALAALAVATVLNVATYAPPWMAALPGLRPGRALVLALSGAAPALTLPGGDAGSLGIYLRALREWGYARVTAVAAIAAVGTANVLVKLALPVIAAVALLATGREATPLLALAGVGAAVAAPLLVFVIAAFRSERAAYRYGARLAPVERTVRRLLRRRPADTIGDRLARFRREAAALVAARWRGVGAWAAVGQLTLFAVLLVALRSLGVPGGDVAAVEAFAAWTTARLLTTVPLTPGGLGIFDLGLTGALVAAGGGAAEVVAAVLLYRLLTWLPVVIPGAAALLLRRVAVP